MQKTSITERKARQGHSVTNLIMQVITEGKNNEAAVTDFFARIFPELLGEVERYVGQDIDAQAVASQCIEKMVLKLRIGELSFGCREQLWSYFNRIIRSEITNLHRHANTLKRGNGCKTVSIDDSHEPSTVNQEFAELELLEELQSHFSHDPIMFDIALLSIAKYSPSEICEQLGFSEATYHRKKKKMKSIFNLICYQLENPQTVRS